MSKNVKPDKPVYSIDASNLEALPDEVRAALEVFFSEQEKADAKKKADENFAYQTLQADTLLGSGAGWVEVATDADDETLLDEVFEDQYPDEYPFFGCHRPSIHQFYRDLYGLSIVAGDDTRFYASAVPDSRISDDGFAVDNEGRVIDAFSGGDYLPVCDKPVSVLVNHLDREHPYQLYDSYLEFIEGVKPETSFIYMGSFWRPENGWLTSRRNAMDDISGFCVDIDRVEDESGKHFGGDWVIDTLVDVLAKAPELEPNYLMLTGTGVQLWYVFGEQIPLLSKKSTRRRKYGNLLKLLYKWFDERLPKNRFKVDVPCASINHAFRAPGSPSKYHYPTRLFVKGGRARRMIDPMDLSRFLGGELMEYDFGEWDQQLFMKVRAKLSGWKNDPATDKQLSYLNDLKRKGRIESIPDHLTKGGADEIIKSVKVSQSKPKKRGKYIETSDGRRLTHVARGPGLYHYTLARLLKDTPAGTRYNAMVGVAGLAWNCEIPREQVERDLFALLDTPWASRLGSDGLPLREEDVRDALRGYNKLGALRSTPQLEYRLGWEYERQKRNWQSMHVHLHSDIWTVYEDEEGNRVRPGQGLRKKVPNDCKVHREFALAEAKHEGRLGRKKGSTKKSTKKGEAIKAYAAQHPEANHSEIARALGVSRPTVIKWLKETR